MLNKKIIDLLDKNLIQYDQFEHEPVRTSEEAARVRGIDASGGAKALIFWAYKNDGSVLPIQLVLQGSKIVDKEKFLQGNTDLKKIKMVSAEEVLEIAGVEPGGVPPFGNLFDPSILVFVDENLVQLDYIEFNAGDKSISIKMKSADWQKMTNPIIKNFATNKI